MVTQGWASDEKTADGTIDAKEKWSAIHPKITAIKMAVFLKVLNFWRCLVVPLVRHCIQQTMPARGRIDGQVVQVVMVNDTWKPGRQVPGLCSLPDGVYIQRSDVSWVLWQKRAGSMGLEKMVNWYKRRCLIRNWPSIAGWQSQSYMQQMWMVVVKTKLYIWQ